jgi:hypothetical protein
VQRYATEPTPAITPCVYMYVYEVSMCSEATEPAPAITPCVYMYVYEVSMCSEATEPEVSMCSDE